MIPKSVTQKIGLNENDYRSESEEEDFTSENAETNNDPSQTPTQLNGEIMVKLTHHRQKNL